VVRFAGLQQPRHNRLPQVVKPSPRQSGGIAQRPPCRVPVARRLGPVQLVMLAGTPQVMRRFRVPEARIFENLLSGPNEPLYAVTSDDKMKHLLGKHGFVERGVTTHGRRGDTLSFWVKMQD
jgi:hypothetical protein